MKQSTGNPPNLDDKTLWSELLPHEFKQRLAECPVVYLPLGLCEPHGQVSAFGLDTLKAEWLCQETAKRVGGIVAPSMGYHIHETGYHASWLEETVGEENPHMTGMPPDIYLSFFLYQLRAFVNAGFKSIVVISGHSGGNQEDLRKAAAIFMKYIPVNIWVRSDPELIEGIYTGDHAGKYEISQLMYIRPDLIDMNALQYEQIAQSGGRLALGDDASEASPELGRAIMEACLHVLCLEVSSRVQELEVFSLENITYSKIETIRTELFERAFEWTTAKPLPGQRKVSSHSKWKPYEQFKIT
jgi:creatinine amidohydrolase